MLHFAYGSNMSRPLMQARCPTAQPLAPAVLEGFAFIVTTDGYASVVPRPGGVVHGVVWRITPRDLAALNAYENVEQGLYRARTLPVRCGDRRRQALVYLARASAPGRPRPGYLAVVVAAAREWGLPQAYVEELARWSPSRWRGARALETGELK
jgi:cation transport regulator ChaC